MPSLADCLRKSRLPSGVKTHLRQRARDSDAVKAVRGYLSVVDGNIEALKKGPPAPAEIAGRIAGPEVITLKAEELPTKFEGGATLGGQVKGQGKSKGPIDFIKRLAREDTDFRANPVMRFSDGWMVVSDGATYKLRPSLFGLDASEIGEGQIFAFDFITAKPTKEPPRAEPTEAEPSDEAPAAEKSGPIEPGKIPARTKPRDQAPPVAGESTTGQGFAVPDYGEEVLRPDFPVSEGSASGSVERRFVVRPVPMPELVQLAKELLGKYPTIKALRKNLGLFKSKEGKPEFAEISIDPKVAKDPVLLAQVLAHEIGHLIDYTPQSTLARGNILGRIASLRKHFADTIASGPGKPGPITPKDRRRLRRIAEQMLKPTESEIEIDEEIRRETPLTPEDVLGIWTSVLDQRAINPELWRYVARLSRAEKKSIVREALKGTVPEQLKRFATVIMEKTGRKIKRTITYTPSQEEIRRKYQELIREEIRKRELLSREEITNELIAVSEWWTPYDKARVPASYIRYRNSSRELYAQALSVFLNTPGELEARAPNFYRGLMNYFERKPEALDAYLDLQDMLAGDPLEVAQARRAHIYEMFARADQKIMAITEARRAARGSLVEMVTSKLSQLILTRNAPIDKKVRRAEKVGMTFEDGQNARYMMDELFLIDNPMHGMLNRMQREVFDPILEADMDDFQMGEYLMLRRVVNERGELANPLGFTPTEAREQIESLKSWLGAERFALLEKNMDRFNEIMFDEVSQRAVDAGLYSQELFEETIEPNKGNYATFLVMKHFEGVVTSSIRKQVGTFQEIANPMLSTLMKAAVTLRHVQLNESKVIVRDLLEAEGSDAIRPAHIPFRADKPRKPPRPGYDYLMMFEDGKLVAYEMPKEIVASFKQHDVGALLQIGRFLQSAVYKVFHPLFVTYNPGFLAANPFRDGRRTYKNMAAIGSKLNQDLRAKHIAQGVKPEQAAILARDQKITLGQVLWAYWKSVPPSFRRARGVNDKLIEQMWDEKALSIPFVSVDPYGETTNFEKLLSRNGIKINEAHGRVRIILGKLLSVLQGTGVIQETMSKVAAFKLLEARGIEPHERSFIVRNYAGTPNWQAKGHVTPVTNSVLMYSNVRWQGLRTDIGLAKNPTTAWGWWWRTVVLSLIPKTAMYSGLIGLFGPFVKRMYEHVSDYFLETYDVIPLGFIEVGDDEEKLLFLTIPQADIDRAIGAVFWAFLRGGGKMFGLEPTGPDVEDTVSSTFDSMWGDIVGSVNPIISIGFKWFDYATGINPVDRFYGSKIVPRDEWEAGGWYRTRRMLSWTANQFGVLSAISHPITGPLLGQFGEDDKERTVETMLRSTPAVSRLLRISDQGLRQQERRLLEVEDEETARFRLGLPDSARRLVRERYVLNRLGVEQLTDRQADRRLELNAYYRDVYLPLTKAMKLAQENDDDQEVESLRESLSAETRDFK